VERASKLPQTHLPTLADGLTTFVVVRSVKRFLPRLPAPLVALIAAVALVEGLELDQLGVTILGTVSAGLPRLSWTPVPSGHLGPLLSGAAGLALVSFTSGMHSSRLASWRRR
jgi:MFS superfamily sulfate permease-like transporter